MTEQINMNKLNLYERMDRPITISIIVNILKSLKSFYKFEDNMLPPEIPIQDIIAASTFISPQIILIHGSYVTKVRYSHDGNQDFDLIVASIKNSFWSKDYLYNEIRSRFQQFSPIKLDISLSSPYGLLAHIYEKTSLGQSLLQGFTILYSGGYRCR